MDLSARAAWSLAIVCAVAGPAIAQDPPHAVRQRALTEAAAQAEDAARSAEAAARAAGGLAESARSDLTKAEEQLAKLEARYRGQDPAGVPTLEAARRVLAGLERDTEAGVREAAQAALGAKRAALQDEIERRTTARAGMEAALRKERETAERECLAWAATQAEVNGPRIWELERDRWDRLIRRRLEAADAHLTHLRTAAAALTEVAERQAGTQAVRLRTIALVRRENLLLRGRNHISWQATQRGLADLARLPGWAAGCATDAWQYATDPAYRGALAGWAVACVLLLLALAGASHGLHRRLQALEADQSPQRGARATLLVGHLLRTAALAGMLALPLLLATWALPDLGDRALMRLRTLGWGGGGAWLTIGAVTVLLRPRVPGAAVGNLEPAVARALWWRTVLLVVCTLCWAPTRVLTEVAGYENDGALQLLDLVFAVFAGGVVLSATVRGTLVAALAPTGSGAAASLGRGLARISRPALLLLVPVILVLLVLRMDLLARALAFGAVALVAVGIIAWLCLHAAEYWLERWAGRAAAGTKGRGRRAMALVGVGRLALRIGVGLAAVWALAALAGLSLDDVRHLLEVPLPLQGATGITWWNLVVAILALLIGLPAARVAEETLRELVLRRTNIDSGVQYTATTLTRYVIGVAAVYLALTQLVQLEQLGYVIAALSVGIGFGLQEVVSNFVSGLILLFERPFKVGDTVRVGDHEGYVRKINIRATTIHTFDNVALMVPNKEFIGNSVVNVRHVDPKVRSTVSVGVSYGSDVERVRTVLLAVAGANPRVLTDPEPRVVFTEFGDSALDFDLRVWLPDPDDRQSVPSELRFAIVHAFREAGIEIPFPQRDLHLRSVAPEARGAVPVPPVPPSDD